MSNVTIDVAQRCATKRRVIGASLLAFVLGWAGCSSPEEHVAKDDGTPGITAEALATTLNPVADTYVRDGSGAGSNFGTSSTLEVKKSTVGFNREAYLRFSLSSFSGTVQNAKLRVFGKISQSGSVPVVARMLQDFAFDESFTTFNIKPETLPIELGRVSVTSTTGAWHEFDVTSLVRQKKRAGDASIDFALVNQVTSTPSVTFNSREATTSKPELVINTATALFVVGNTTLNSGDAAVSARLSQLGFLLTTKTAATATTADATGKSLVVVSATVASADVNTKYRDVAVPLVVCENAIFDDMKMTGTVANTDFGTTANLTNVAISNNLHALAGGREGSVAVSGSNPLTWGKPGASGLKIATVPGDATKTTVFAYDKGIAMVGMNAPERRVGLFLGDATAASFNRSGWAIFDAAINWASYSKPFITKKVGVFIYDPILESKPGQPRLSAFLGWPNPHDLARQAVTQFSQTSGDYVRYQITTDVDVDEWPLREDNQRYTDQGYLDDYAQPPCTKQNEATACLSHKCIVDEGQTNGICEQNLNKPWAKYPELIAARQWDQGINNGTYDEVWVGGPRGIGFFESKMVGQGALTVNSDPVVPPQTVANRRYMIEFLDWTVPLAFFQHGYVHRIEWLMRYVYFEKWGQDALNYPFPSNWNTSPYEPACLFGASGCSTVRRHLWDKFTLVDGVAQNLRAHGDPTAVAGVGTAHYVPGAQVNPGDNYNYGAVPAVTSNADDWMFNFPNLTGESRSLSVSEWQANWCWGDYQCGFMLWFNNHLPRAPGRSSAADRNVLLNWWEYAVNFEDYAETKP